MESILAQNGYPRAFVKKVMREKEQKVKKFQDPELTRISVPYLSGTSVAIGRSLRPLGLSLAHRSESWKWPLCSGLKDAIADSRRTGVIYEIPCADCNDRYIGESGRSIWMCGL